MEKEDWNNAIGFVFSLVNQGLALMISHFLAIWRENGYSYNGALRFFELFGVHIAFIGVTLSLLRFKFDFDYIFPYAYNYFFLFFLFTIHFMLFELTAWQ